MLHVVGTGRSEEINTSLKPCHDAVPLFKPLFEQNIIMVATPPTRSTSGQRLFPLLSRGRVWATECISSVFSRCFGTTVSVSALWGAYCSLPSSMLQPALPTRQLDFFLWVSARSDSFLLGSSSDIGCSFGENTGVCSSIFTGLIINLHSQCLTVVKTVVSGAKNICHSGSRAHSKQS